MSRASAGPDPSDLPYYGFRDTRGVRRAGARLAHRLHRRGRLRGVPAARTDAERVFRGAARGGPAGGRRARAASARATRCGSRRRWRSTATTSTTRSRPGGGSRLDRQDGQGRLHRPRRARARRRQAGVPRKLVGFEMVDRGIARHGYPARTRRTAPASSRPARIRRRSAGRSASRCCPSAAAAVGTEFDVEIRGRDGGGARRRRRRSTRGRRR